jgi:predicted HAD superfamily Cof-like phosphohydrolase
MDNAKTALQVAFGMDLPGYAIEAMRHDRHPQERTMAFHKFYGAPIHAGRTTSTFGHMSNERVAFRAGFILGEVAELLAKGLGIQMHVSFETTHGDWSSSPIPADDDPAVASTIHNALDWAGKRDLVEVVDALGDLNVVVNGFAIELGVDMMVVDQEICASNFTKAGADGQPIIGDGTNGPVGKVLKGPNYKEPQLALTLGLEK